MLSRLLVSLVFLSTLYANLDHTDALENEVNRKTNLGYIEGDILTNPHPSRARRQARNDHAYVRWPNGNMRLGFDETVSEGTRSLITHASAYINDHVCAGPWQVPRDYDVLVSGKQDQGCGSYVGRIYFYKPPQDFFFADNCQLFGVAVHELMHAMGIWHHHVRYDRDEYLYENMDKRHGTDYQKKSNRTTLNFTPFDYGSVMLYGANPNLKPVEKNMDYYYTMGSRRVTFYDMKTLYAFYNCSTTCQGMRPPRCKNGGIPHPYCDVCNCPTGWGGDLCDKPAIGDYTAVYKVTQDWVSYRSSLTYDGNTEWSRSYYDTGILFFRAPTYNVTIEFQLTKMTNFTCTTGCSFGSVEVKYKGDPRITSPLICCTDTDMWQRVYSPKTDVLIVAFDTRQKNVEIEYRVRYVNKKPNDGKVVTNGFDNYKYYAD